MLNSSKFILQTSDQLNSSKFLLQIDFQSVHGYSPLHFVDVLRRSGAAGIVHAPVGIAHVLNDKARTDVVRLGTSTNQGGFIKQMHKP